jgi:DNA modification methylase
LLYGQQYELIFVFKVGKGAPINNVAVGACGGTKRTFGTSLNASNMITQGKVAPRSAVKPLAMITDVIRNFSKQAAVILDPFGGAGNLLIAAERTGRRARVIELDPIFVDISIERWQRLTGGRARHGENGRPFVRPGNTGVLSGHNGVE